MAKILKRTSFGLVRTNPRLTTNIKIVADSKNKIYLESIDANPLLSKSIYKGYEVSYNGSYSYDLNQFYTQNGSLLPKDVAYTVFEEDDSLEIKNRYFNQFDFTYGAGFAPKNSKIYSEEYSIFAPLWIESNNIPEYFVIFKMDGPVTINANKYDVDLDDSTFLNDLIENPENFFKNYIQKAKIIKSIDLSNKSGIGKYIRNHVNDTNFPESPLYSSIEKNNLSYWKGISYDNGGFASKSREIYKDYTLVDKTVIESDDFITGGFKHNSIVSANILNLEFLFDDTNQTEYEFSRYFGMYMSEVELGKFTIDSTRLYNDRDVEFNQSPRPDADNVGVATNTTDQFQLNKNGIKIYPSIGASGIYSGRLLTFDEIQNPRFPYVKDTTGNLYSINNVNDWKSTRIEMPLGATGTTAVQYEVTDSNYIRIKDNEVNWKDFSGFNEPFEYVQSYKTEHKGRANIGFSIVGPISNGDEIRVRYTDWNDPVDIPFIDTHTVRASSTLEAGTNSGLLFSNLGTKKQIASSIAAAINSISYYGYEIFSAISNGSEVVVFARVESEVWNKLKISLFSDSTLFPFDISNQYETVSDTTNYQPTPIASAPTATGKFIQSNFGGGNDNPNSRAIIEKSKIMEFVDDNDVIYLKTDKGYYTTGEYGLYLDKPVLSDEGEVISFTDIEKYYVINLSDLRRSFQFGSSSKLALYKLAKNTCGYLSTFPVKDFDFDFHNDDYNRDGDSDVSKLYEWYQGIIGSTGSDGSVPTFDWSIIGSTAQDTINNIIGPSSSFLINGEFKKLIGYVDELTDTEEVPFNEYSRLKENTLSELALSSRIVPFINKWVYDNESVNVREVGYRLNSNGTFGYSNFSPSYDELSRNPKFFTHEWYYLQEYPPYMSFDEKLNSYSYFDNNLYLPEIPEYGSIGSTATYTSLIGATGSSANLLSINEDYFLSYFTRETVDNLPITRDFKYSLFSDGDNFRPSETMFRGAKVSIKDRNEFSLINYNKDTLRYINNEKYNGYKFSAILTYGNAGSQITCIKNDKYKSVTLVIQANLDDILLTYGTSDGIGGVTGPYGKFIDRGMLYCIADQLGASGSSISIKDKPISGNIVDWDDTGGEFIVYGGLDSNGNYPSFASDITLNEDGSYNYLEVTDGINTYNFKNITEVKGDQFKCTSIEGLPVVGNITPNTTYSYSNITTIWYPSQLTYALPLSNNPIYINGGYNAYKVIMDSISFSSIAYQINAGDPEVRYINVNTSGELQFNTYVIELNRPDYPITSTYLERAAIKKSSSDLQINAPILGYRLTAMDRISLTNISRYRGGYSPKWKDLIKFVDTDDIKNENLDYNNIQILTTLSDNGIEYLRDNNLGKIQNLYYNKVNVENPNIILDNQKYGTDGSPLVYPLVGQIAIDYDSHYTFKSNWDVNYYSKYTKADTKIKVIGTREPKEEKSFFGSKVISIPNTVNIETFPNGIITKSELIDAGSIQNTDKNLVTEEVTLPNSTQLNIDVYVTKALQDWLIADGFGDTFYTYINDNYSFGNVGLDDDIKTYISDNIFERYSIREIIMWEKDWNPNNSTINPNQIEFNLTDSQKIDLGYSRSKNFRAITDTSGGLNFKLIYTIPSDRKTSIAISVILEKK